MFKKMLIGIGILAGVIVTAGAVGGYFYLNPNQDFLLSFLKDNPERMAIKLVRNDTVLVAKNVDQVSPLASTVKIIIAIEYAEQATLGTINPDEMIALSELDQYYVPNTDGGAHPAWLKSAQSKIADDAIPLREIAKGMIKYSSNANTEWLCDRLGLNLINQRLDRLGIKNHTPLYNIVSALFVGKEKLPELKGDAVVTALQEMTKEEYITATAEIHKKLKTDTTYKDKLGFLAFEIQRVWSDNLPASTVGEYVGIMQKFNSKTYFSPTTQQYLDEVMEFLMENPANQAWLKHSGMKGGSTAFVLTEAMYATDQQGNTTELAYFFHDLNIFEGMRLQNSMNEFELSILKSEEFRRKMQEELGE